MATWYYFATPALAGPQETLDMATSGYVWRSAYNSVGIAIANTRKVNHGDRIVLLFEGVPQLVVRVLDPNAERVDNFPALAYFPTSLDAHMQAIGYRRDPIKNRFIGFLVDLDGDGTDPVIWQVAKFRRPDGNRNALQPESAVSALQRSEGKVSIQKTSESRAQSFQSVVKLLENASKLTIPQPSHKAKFSDLSSPHLPIVGSLFLGVDVGYAKIRESLGYCILERFEKGLKVCPKAGKLRGFGLKTLEVFKSDFLLGLLDEIETSPFKGIAFDGPLTPTLRGSPPFYRPQDKFLAGGKVPRRIKAQPYQSPVGRALYEATMALRDKCSTRGYKYEPFGAVIPGKEKMILESFPKIWLALFFDPEHVYANLGLGGTERSVADYTMARWLFLGIRPEGFKGDVVDISARLRDAGLSLCLDSHGTQTVFADKDLTAAFVSALGSVLAYIGWASVIGSDEFGSFLLPASGLWHPGWRDIFGDLPDGLNFRDCV